MSVAANLSDVEATNSTKFMAGMLPSEYVNVIGYLVIISVGLPLNADLFRRLWREYRYRPSQLILVNLHLTVSNILVLLCYCLGRAIWISTGEWLGGDWLCRAMRFMDFFVLTVNSFIMTVMTLDRLEVIRKPLTPSRIHKTTIMLLIAWSTAIFTSTPQLVLWSSMYFESFGWWQCVSWWTMTLHNKPIENGQFPELSPFETHTLHIYNIYHLLMGFWVAFVAISICYVTIVYYMIVVLPRNRWHSTPKTAASGYAKRKQSPADDGFALRIVSGVDRMATARVRSVQTALLVISVYLITWLPYNVAVALSAFYDTFREKYDAWIQPLDTLLAVSCVINPLISRITIGNRRGRKTSRSGFLSLQSQRTATCVAGHNGTTVTDRRGTTLASQRRESNMVHGRNSLQSQHIGYRASIPRKRDAMLEDVHMTKPIIEESVVNSNHVIIETSTQELV